MQDYSIERVGLPDLDFNGEMIGQGPGATPRLRIYRTKGGKFIGQFSADSDRSHAAPFEKPADLLTWLKGQAGYPIPDDVQAAIEQAAKKDESFKAFWTERVE